jgi:hypothetical protein
MSAPPDRIAALGFSPEARPLLQRLVSAGVVGRIRWPGDAVTPSSWLQEQWPEVEAVVAVGACGLVVRLIAPLLGSKAEDPAVVVFDPRGRFAVPLLGGHGAGGEAFAQELAALIGAEAAITGSATASGRLALDGFGEAWGWRRGHGHWTALLQAAARPGPGPAVEQASGLVIWRDLAAAQQQPSPPSPPLPGGTSAEPLASAGSPAGAPPAVPVVAALPVIPQAEARCTSPTPPAQSTTTDSGEGSMALPATQSAPSPPQRRRRNWRFASTIDAGRDASGIRLFSGLAWVANATAARACWSGWW